VGRYHDGILHCVVMVITAPGRVRGESGPHGTSPGVFRTSGGCRGTQVMSQPKKPSVPSHDRSGAEMTTKIEQRPNFPALMISRPLPNRYCLHPGSSRPRPHTRRMTFDTRLWVSHSWAASRAAVIAAISTATSPKCQTPLEHQSSQANCGMILAKSRNQSYA
jgi:hypothetical protein